VKDDEIFTEELNAWNVDTVGDHRASRLRSRCSNFLEKFVASLLYFGSIKLYCYFFVSDLIW